MGHQRIGKYCAIVSGIVAVGLGVPAAATVIVDQSTLVSGGIGPITTGILSFTPPSGPAQLRAIQTFTAGVGGYLDHVEFQLLATGFTREPGTITIELFDGNAASSSATMLKSVAFSSMNLPTNYFATETISVDVRNVGFLVTPGQLLSARIGFVADDGAGSVGAVIGNVSLANPLLNYVDYAGGELFVASSLAAGVAATGRDIGFRSFVDTLAAAAVPEPSTWALMIGGFGVAGTALRRRAAKVAFA